MSKTPPIHTQRLIYFKCIASRFISLGYALREFGREGYRSCPAILSTDRRGKAMKRYSIRQQRLICFKYFTTLIKSKFNESKSLDALLEFYTVLFSYPFRCLFYSISLLLQVMRKVLWTLSNPVRI
jgi:hypothetical protein